MKPKLYILRKAGKGDKCKLVDSLLLPFAATSNKGLDCGNEAMFRIWAGFSWEKAFIDRKVFKTIPICEEHLIEIINKDIWEVSFKQLMEIALIKKSKENK